MTKTCVKNNETFIDWEALENEEPVNYLDLLVKEGRISQKEADLIRVTEKLNYCALHDCEDTEWKELLEQYENLRKELKK